VTGNFHLRGVLAARETTYGSTASAQRAHPGSDRYRKKHGERISMLHVLSCTSRKPIWKSSLIFVRASDGVFRSAAGVLYFTLQLVDVAFRLELRVAVTVPIACSAVPLASSAAPLIRSLSMSVPPGAARQRRLKNDVPTISSGVEVAFDLQPELQSLAE